MCRVDMVIYTPIRLNELWDCDTSVIRCVDLCRYAIEYRISANLEVPRDLVLFMDGLVLCIRRTEYDAI